MRMCGWCHRFSEPEIGAEFEFQGISLHSLTHKFFWEMYESLFLPPAMGEIVRLLSEIIIIAKKLVTVFTHRKKKKIYSYNPKYVSALNETHKVLINRQKYQLNPMSTRRGA